MRAAFARLCEIDFLDTRSFLILTVLFFAVRLPYINYGHGTDPDAWRVALTAHYLWDNGDYFPSRLPGNPLHELTMTLFIPGGWIATNLATAVVSLVAVWVFARIVKELELPNPGLLVIGFAFAPLLIINSISTMDYMWTLTFLLGSYYALLRGNSPLLARPALRHSNGRGVGGEVHSLIAGILLGLAVGFRLQSAILWLPFAYLLWRQDRRREIVPFSLAAGGTALIAFAPVLAVYGLDFVNYYDAAVGWQDVVRLLGKEALGVLGVIGVLAGVLLSLRRFKQFLPDLLQDANVGVWLASIVLFFISFSNLPHEIAYLIPVFPFGFFLIGRYFTRAGLGVAVAAILLAGVIDITTPGSGISPTTLREATPGKGLVLSNADTMSGQHEFVDLIMANPITDHSVVITGFLFPQLAVREGDHLEAGILHRDYGAIAMLSDRGEAVDEERDIRFVWLLTYDTFAALRAEGYRFYMSPDAGGSTYALYDYRPTLFGAVLLELDRAEESVSEGQAGTDR